MHSGEKEKILITDIKNKRWDITADFINIESIIKEYYEQIQISWIHSQPRLNGQIPWMTKWTKVTKEEIENLNTPISIKEINL